jgi:hypothetical protein
VDGEAETGVERTVARSGDRVIARDRVIEPQANAEEPNNAKNKHRQECPSTSSGEALCDTSNVVRYIQNKCAPH